MLKNQSVKVDIWHSICGVAFILVGLSFTWLMLYVYPESLRWLWGVEPLRNNSEAVSRVLLALIFVTAGSLIFAVCRRPKGQPSIFGLARVSLFYAILCLSVTWSIFANLKSGASIAENRNWPEVQTKWPSKDK
jgi:hypothetical protein